MVASSSVSVTVAAPRAILVAPLASAVSARWASSMSSWWVVPWMAMSMRSPPYQSTAMVGVVVIG